MGRLSLPLSLRTVHLQYGYNSGLTNVLSKDETERGMRRRSILRKIKALSSSASSRSLPFWLFEEQPYDRCLVLKSPRKRVLLFDNSRKFT
ncbi:hypothetical protein TNIN_197771 [Trichonephila inaurata madagascariensis]|uniref:Uncharacterized protein n=1 Tax=Trichonephila inaurata madagascariensis TaxID=2747483 RepID=A0A8X6Y4Z2_9ARAC|nr:hypothetical protein TNIN_197771 [Trichonephila inaurata madagascariensis]